MKAIMFKDDWYSKPVENSAIEFLIIFLKLIKDFHKHILKRMLRIKLTIIKHLIKL